MKSSTRFLYTVRRNLLKSASGWKSRSEHKFQEAIMQKFLLFGLNLVAVVFLLSPLPAFAQPK